MARKLHTAVSRYTGVRKKSRPPVVPLVGFASPIGIRNDNQPGWFPPTRIEDYGIITTEGPRPAAFRGINIFYRSAITAGVNNTNIFESEALANNWQLIGTNGQTLRNGQYGGVLCDVGLASYRNRWMQAAEARMTSLASDGMWIDDATPRVADFTGGVWPQKYPTMDAYKAVLVEFAQAVYAYFNPRGKKMAYNTGVSLDNTGALTAAWWPQIGPWTHYLTSEYWLHVPGQSVRTVGTAWWQNWDGYRNLHTVAKNAGAGFLPVMDGTGGLATQAYSLGTFMLDWTGTPQGGANQWMWSYVTQQDPWSTFYSQAIALGKPAAAPVQISSNVWRRQYQNGTVTVNANTGVATIP